MARKAFLPIDNRRGRDLARIHIGKAALGMADEEYRAMLHAVARVDSAAKLDYTGLQRVLEHLRKLGAFRPRAGGDRQLRLIRHLWHRLHAAGAVEHDTEQALRAFCERVTHKAQPAWMSTGEARAVIEALKSWLARVEPAVAAEDLTT